MTHMTTTVTTTAHSTEEPVAIIRKGQMAWTAIKATAAEQRTLWLEVGVALQHGKEPGNRPQIGVNRDRSVRRQPFSAWVKESFPGLGCRSASSALWFAANSEIISEIPACLTHPVAIQRWADGADPIGDLEAELKAAPGDADAVLKEEPAPTKKATVTPRAGKRLVELHHRRETKGEGSEQAASAFRAYARQYEVTEEELLQAAREAAPDAFYRFSPSIQDRLDSFRQNLIVSIADMRAAGFQTPLFATSTPTSQPHFERTGVACPIEATPAEAAVHRYKLIHESDPHYPTSTYPTGPLFPGHFHP